MVALLLIVHELSVEVCLLLILHDLPPSTTWWRSQEASATESCIAVAIETSVHLLWCDESKIKMG